MSAFDEILPLFGVDGAKGSMRVPVGGFNLIFHSLGKEPSVSASAGKNSASGRLSIVDVTDEMRKKPDLSHRFKKLSPLFVDKDDQTAFLQAAAHKLTNDPGQRLVAVSAQTLGIYTVKLAGSRRQETLTVSAINERPAKVSFRYVKYTGEWPPPGADQRSLGNYSRGTSRAKTEGAAFAELLNKYFKHQANVAISLQNSDDIGIDKPFGKTLNRSFFDNNLKDKFDKSADITIFVVEFIEGAEGVKQTSQAVMVAQKPQVVWSGNKGIDSFTGDAAVDNFLFVCAHELAHALGSGHRSDGGLLMSDFNFKQSFLIDNQTITEINPPFAR